MWWDDNKNPTLTVGFEFSAVDRGAFGVDDDHSSNARDMACECQRRVWHWIYQPPCEDLDGWTCRCIVAAWIFVPQLRSYTMTRIAERFGKKKQSLGRWVADFKKEFPEVCKHLSHLKHD